jgi:isoquinoline 1-oxidoreductase beta subunit
VTILRVNGKDFPIAMDPATPILWILRDTLQLKGTKYGCGVGICGSCTVLADGQPVRACITPLSAMDGRSVVTIEGLAEAGHPLLDAWVAEQVPQCGYCQPGQIVAAAALLATHSRPDDAAIDDAISDVLCRCGTYQRIRRAIHRAAEQPAFSQSAPAPAWRLPPPGHFAPNPWVRVHEDGTVTVLIDRSEMGQGVVGALSVLVAEELEVDPARVRTEFAPADPAYSNRLLGGQLTGGSTSIRAAWEPLRRAGAEAREMLVEAAAQTWGVDRSECRAETGTVLHPASGRQMPYGALVDKAAALPAPKRVTLKNPADFRLIGRAVPRSDIPQLASGAGVFGMDVSLPSMVVAAVLRCPVSGGKVASFDATEALRVPGVRHVLEITTGIAVVADSFMAALAGRSAVDVAWSEGPNRALSSPEIRRRLRRAAERPGEVAQERGDATGILNRSGAVIEAAYETPYLAHGTLEPMNCTARVGPDGCDVWVPTQNQEGARETAARISGLPESAVRVHTTFLGGGFGRRLEQDFVEEAVLVAKAVGAPVQLIWTREDDMRHDFYRPANCSVIRAGLDAHGRPLAWFQRVAGPALSLDGVDIPYDIPNLRLEFVEEDPGIPTGPWRSVGASQNAFAVESFMDELAHAAGKDPFAFRCDLLGHHPRHRAVLELAAEKVGWTHPPGPGKGRGIALYHSYGGWVAQVAEVFVPQAGEIRVERVVCAVDCGMAVNPDGVAAQMEGAVVFGLSAALRGEITIDHGKVQQRNFEDYPLLSMREMPEVEVHILAGGKIPGGVGEPGVPPVAPAVANALFAATGRRLRSLPLFKALQQKEREF